MEVGWDVATNSVLMKGTSVCETCCAGGEAEYGDDCPCFLDPDIPVWSGAVEYFVGDIVQHGGVGDAGRCYQCILQHTNQEPPNATYWAIKSSVAPCGNENWNDYPPYGGFGKTPLYYTISFVRIDCRDIMTSNVTKVIGQYDRCDWEGVTNYPFHCFKLNMDCNSTTFRRGWFQIPGGCNYDYEWPGDIYKIEKGGCAIAANNEEIFFDDCEFPGNLVGTWIVSWHPGIIEQWSAETTYEGGDQVSWKGVFYTCILGHINHEPPNAAYWEPWG